MTVYPADVVLFEGILAFYSQEVRDLFHMKLFVDTDADTRLSRRGASPATPRPARHPRRPEPEARAFPEGSPGPARPSGLRAARAGPAAHTTGRVKPGSVPPCWRSRKAYEVPEAKSDVWSWFLSAPSGLTSPGAAVKRGH